MVQALANPCIRINGQTVSIVPNTAKITPGYGETNVRSASAGGNSITTVHTSNAESKIGGFDFELYNTVANIKAIAAWKNAISGNEITGIETVSGDETASITLKTASLCNDPVLEITADGTLPLEWKGDPVTIG